MGDRGGEAVTLNNLGGVWSALGEKAKALEYYGQALSLYHAVGDRGGEARTLNNIGGVYYALGDLDQAIAYLERCIAIDEQVDDPKLEEYRRILEQLRRERDGRGGAAAPRA